MLAVSHVSRRRYPAPVTTRNWAGNYEFTAPRIAAPTSIDELRELISGSERIRAVGTRHSFNDIADSPGTMVSLEALPTGVETGGVEIDAGGSAVWAPAGIRYGDLGRILEQNGLALHNLASLPHISVAGTIATGTHGSGIRNGSLATAVAGLELVGADGELTTLRRGEPDFDGAVVSLGALGVVSRVLLDTRPSFELAQDVLLDLSFETVADNLLEILALGYSTSIFTRWTGNDVDQLWVKHRPEDALTETYGGTPAPGEMHPIAGVDPLYTTKQGGVPGPWLDRLPHFRLEFTPSAGDELQSEFFVPAESGADALRAVAALADAVVPVLLVSEIRAIAADELWLSGAYGRDTVAFHFTWQQRPAEVAAVVAQVEAALRPFGGRPHWGKVFTAERDAIAPLYPRFDDFLALRDRLDPGRKFVDRYLERVLLGGRAAAAAGVVR
jgi:xylitol oxidase